MAASEYIPLSLADQTREGLTKKLLVLQAEQGGKVSIISIYYDGRNHVCWYYPLRNLGGGIM